MFVSPCKKGTEMESGEGMRGKMVLCSLNEDTPEFLEQRRLMNVAKTQAEFIGNPKRVIRGRTQGGRNGPGDQRGPMCSVQHVQNEFCCHVFI